MTAKAQKNSCYKTSQDTPENSKQKETEGIPDTFSKKTCLFYKNGENVVVAWKEDYGKQGKLGGNKIDNNYKTCSSQEKWAFEFEPSADFFYEKRKNKKEKLWKKDSTKRSITQKKAKKEEKTIETKLQFKVWMEGLFFSICFLLWEIEQKRMNHQKRTKQICLGINNNYL